MDVTILVSRCRQQIIDSSTNVITELEDCLREQQGLIEEQRLDNIALNEWRSRVEARRLANLAKDVEIRAGLTSRISELEDMNHQLQRVIEMLKSEVATNKIEMCRLSQEALETCNVSRTVMLQNMHTRMETEIKTLHIRLASSQKQIDTYKVDGEVTP